LSASHPGELNYNSLYDMKKKLLYILLALIVINVLINGLINFINLVLSGIVLAVFASKEKTGDFSLWKLILGIGIASCSILIGVMRIAGMIKF
jgi:hypothetical protein